MTGPLLRDVSQTAERLVMISVVIAMGVVGKTVSVFLEQDSLALPNALDKSWGAKGRGG